MRPRNKKLLLVCFILVLFGLGCMAAFDLGAMHTCSRSGGTLLKTYECIDASDIPRCVDNQSRYRTIMPNDFSLPGNITIIRGDN